MDRRQDGGVTVHGAHRLHLAVDCECGTTVEGCDEEELFDELLEHISAVHESGLRREPAVMMGDALRD